MIPGDVPRVVDEMVERLTADLGAPAAIDDAIETLRYFDAAGAHLELVIAELETRQRVVSERGLRMLLLVVELRAAKVMPPPPAHDGG